MDPSLIEAITEMVLRELRGRAEPPPPRGKPVLLCPGPGPLRPDTRQVLAAAEGVAWTAVGSLGDFPARIVPAPSCWEEAVTAVEAVVLPSVRLDTLSRIALLLGDSPPSAAAIAGVVQGKPVMICSDGVERYRRHSARLPGGFLSVFNSHLRAVEGLGIEVLEAPDVVARLAGSSVRLSSASGRDVVTLEDLEAAARRGQKVLEVSSGAIVTPLAREKATQMGIEVRFQ